MKLNKIFTEAILDSKLAAANGALQLMAKAAGLLEGQPQAPKRVSKVTVAEQPRRL